MSSALGSTRRAFWNENGFLVLPGFVAEDELEAIENAYERAWTSMDSSVVVDDLVTNRRCRITDLSGEERRHNFKVNDLYLKHQDLREVALSERLGLVLEELLGDEPAVCNTLNFDKGSQQADHLDTLYMTPVTDGALVATWMALEDTDADAGPLRYYPGSNKIDPYRFSNSSLHQVDAEVPQWSDYMANQVDRNGLEEQRFMAKKGDLFIWDAYLLHSGSKIERPELTRRSLVTHYWAQHDVNDWDLRPAPGGWWINKPPLRLPNQVPTADLVEEETATYPPGVAHGSDVAGAELHDRLESLQYSSD